MKILKYIFLLLLLAFIALTIFIATQKGKYDVERSTIIKSPRSTVFNYVNDYKNWESFGSWKKEDPKMKFIYPQNTIGKGASYSWEGSDGVGTMKTVDLKENESIHQEMNFNGSLSDVHWTFKDTVGGTKVSWRSKGQMSFGFKIYSAFHGGADGVIGEMYEKSLANLDKTLDYEINTYAIKVNGIVEKPGCFYLRQTITSTIANVPRNLQIMMPKVINFCKDNNLAMSGKPFVLYHTYDLTKGITKMSVCVPIKELIYTSPGSDISSGNLEPFQAVKTTLTGDYSHLKEAWNKTFGFIVANNLIHKSEAPYLEEYSISMEEVTNPSKWVTEIYIPLKAKEVVVYKPRPVKVEPVVPAEPAAEIPAP